MARRRVHSADDLRDIAEDMQVPAEELERDFVLVAIAFQLATTFPRGLCFKGGFALRHAHGQLRVSRDIDATGPSGLADRPATAEVREAIVGISQFSGYRPKVGEPATDSPRSLDFDSITYRGLIADGRVSVEVSFREAVVAAPRHVLIGEPFFDPFAIPVMDPSEMAAEKLRTLAQRRRPTDLSDLDYLLSGTGLVNDDTVRSLVPAKFAPGLVKPGNPYQRIVESILSMESEYDRTVPGVAPGAASYADASRRVLERLPQLLP